MTICYVTEGGHQDQEWTHRFQGTWQGSKFLWLSMMLPRSIHCKTRFIDLPHPPQLSRAPTGNWFKFLELSAVSRMLIIITKKNSYAFKIWHGRPCVSLLNQLLRVLGSCFFHLEYVDSIHCLVGVCADFGHYEIRKLWIIGSVMIPLSRRRRFERIWRCGLRGRWSCLGELLKKTSTGWRFR